MTYIPLIRANVMHGVIALLQQLDAPTERLLTEAKLPPALLQEPETLLPLSQVLSFMEDTAQKMGIDQFGLLAGQHTQIANLGALGQLLYHSPTLQEAINTLIRLISSYNSGDRIWLQDQGKDVWLCRKLGDRLEGASPQAVQCSLMIMIHLVQLAAGSQWMPSEIHLATPPVPGFNQVKWLSNTEVFFNQDATGIAIPRTLLNTSLRASEGYEEEQKEKDYEILSSSAPAMTFPASLRQIIEVQLKQGYPAIQATAKVLGVSVRSFQRQLSQADLTYSYLVEQVRFEQAVQLLSDPTNKVADIASELGYKDPANFTRAFKRWTGIPPKAYSMQEQGLTIIRSC